MVVEFCANGVRRPEEQFARLWEDLIGRLHGPWTLRLLLQPAMAIFFATRAGLRDAREGREPYFWRLFKNPAHLGRALHEEWHDVGKVFVLAVILDFIYQWLVLGRIYPVPRGPEATGAQP